MTALTQAVALVSRDGAPHLHIDGTAVALLDSIATLRDAETHLMARGWRRRDAWRHCQHGWTVHIERPGDEETPE